MKFSDWMSLICLGLALVILWRFRQIVLLMFAAVVIAIALNSLVRRLVRTFRWSRPQAVAAAALLVFLASGLFIGLILPLFVDQFQELLKLTPRGFEQLSSWFYQFAENPPEWVSGDWRGMLREGLPEFSDIIQQATSIGTTVFGNFFSFFSSSMAILLQLLLLLVLTLMLLADPLAYRRLLLRLFPSWYRRRVDQILGRCESALLCWMGGVSISSLFVAIFSFMGLVLLDVPYAFAHAMLAGLFNFLPNIGPTISAVFPIFVALLQSPGKAVAVVVLYTLIQNLESYWISPMMMHKQVSLLPAATLIAQIFFATFLGPLGLILGLPLAVICKTWIEEAWITDILDQGQPGPAAIYRGIYAHGHQGPMPSPPASPSEEPAEAQRVEEDL